MKSGRVCTRSSLPQAAPRPSHHGCSRASRRQPCEPVRITHRLGSGQERAKPSCCQRHHCIVWRRVDKASGPARALQICRRIGSAGQVASLRLWRDQEVRLLDGRPVRAASELDSGAACPVLLQSIEEAGRPSLLNSPHKAQRYAHTRVIARRRACSVARQRWLGDRHRASEGEDGHRQLALRGHEHMNTSAHPCLSMEQPIDIHCDSLQAQGNNAAHESIPCVPAQLL